MEIKEFAQKVRHRVEESLGYEYHTEIKEVRKNNGVILHGLLISSPVGNIIPTIYLDSFLEAYERGTPFTQIINRILEIYREETPRESIDMEFFRTFEGVKDRICYRMIHKTDNEELLGDVPYLNFLDFAVCFYYAYQGSLLGDGSILIHNNHMELWGIDKNELLRLAKVNTPRLFPHLCIPMTEFLKDYEVARELQGIYLPMKVLTNASKTFGASCLLYEGLLEKLSKDIERGFYILPSSIHEGATC